MAKTADILIEKINKLQELCSQASIQSTLDLPQIVVVGSQSSGKTSVLENIVGKDFLPRGSCIVTRRPLTLQLICEGKADPPYCEFAHSEKRYFDFAEVKKEIQDETERVLKTKHDVSHVPIVLKFYSNKVLPLTLVDLPGLTKVPLGDQPKNICLRIEEMCRKYVENKNAIILAVSAANTDIANSDALQMARSVDPEYRRTVGVLTKLDIMDRGTDVVDVLGQKKVNLKLGFVPVVNRSQEDIVAGKGIEEALQDEKRFFEMHSSYKKNKFYCGTPYLVWKLNNILHDHIRTCLPVLQLRIDKLLAGALGELESIGTINFTPKEFVFKVINDVSKRFGDVLQGRSELSSTELCGGARLNYTFHHHFAEFISGLEALGDVRDEEIRTMLYNSSGSSSTILFAHVAFEKLAKQSIAKLKPHVLKLVNIVFNELVKILHKICNDLNVSQFPVLSERIVNSLVALFRTRSENTQRLVGAFVEWNVEYINTRNPEFSRWRAEKGPEHGEVAEEALGDKVSKITFDPIPHTLRITKNMSEQETAEVEMVKSLVKRYFGVIKGIVVDQVPKAIMAELVLSSERDIQAVLFREVYEAEDVSETVCESREIRERRAALEKSISALRDAHDIIFSI